MINQVENIDIFIIKQIFNEISLKEKDLLYEWINESNDNQKYFIEVVKTFEQSTINLQSKEQSENSYNYFESVFIKKNRIKYLKPILSIAAVFLLGIVMSIIIYGKQSSEIIVQASNHKKTITLPDSSIVWLNSNSTIKYNNKFKKQRRIELIGEAYFEVKKDKEHPFIVKTDNLQINVLGTKFIVTDYKISSTAETILKCGSINLFVNNSKDKLLVRKDQKVSFSKKDRQLNVENVNADNYTNWTQSKLVFENNKLEDVFTQMEKWYNIKIECESADINKIPVSFSIDKESIADVFNLLEAIIPISWSINDLKDELGRSTVVVKNKK